MTDRRSGPPGGRRRRGPPIRGGGRAPSGGRAGRGLGVCRGRRRGALPLRSRSARTHIVRARRRHSAPAPRANAGRARHAGGASTTAVETSPRRRADARLKPPAGRSGARFRPPGGAPRLVWFFLHWKGKSEYCYPALNFRAPLSRTRIPPGGVGEPVSDRRERAGAGSRWVGRAVAQRQRPPARRGRVGSAAAATC